MLSEHRVISCGITELLIRLPLLFAASPIRYSAARVSRLCGLGHPLCFGSLVRMNLNRKVLLAALVGTITVTGFGCRGTWDLDVSIDTPVGEGALIIHHEGGKTRVDEVPGDATVDIEFLDENGDAIDPGAQGVGEGESVQTPGNAKSVVISGASNHTGGCTGCTGVATPPWAAGDPPSPFVEMWIQVLPLVPDYSTGGSFGNAIFSADVRVPESYDAREIYEFIRPLLIQGPGYPVPHSDTEFDISITSFTRLIPNASALADSQRKRPSGKRKATSKKAGRAGFTLYSMDETLDFTSFDLSMNGFQAGDNGVLATGQYYDAPNGWKVIEVKVPDAALLYGATFASMFGHLHTRTTEDGALLETNFDLAAAE